MNRHKACVYISMSTAVICFGKGENYFDLYYSPVKLSIFHLKKFTWPWFCFLPPRPHTHTNFGQQWWDLGFKQLSEEMVELFHSFPGGFSFQHWKPSRGTACDPLITGTCFSLFSSDIPLQLKDNLRFVLTKLQLSVYSGKSGIQSLMKSNAKKLAEQDESVLMTSGIPYTIIRTGELQNTPGGKQGFTFDKVRTDYLC